MFVPAQMVIRVLQSAHKLIQLVRAPGLLQSPFLTAKAVAAIEVFFLNEVLLR